MESRRKINNDNRSPQRKELVFKFLVIGDYGVGKTAFVRRYTDGKFSSNYKVTIGADFCMKTLQWDANTIVNLQLWDIAGHEKFGYMTRVYYKLAVGCVIMFDIARYSTYESVSKWLLDLKDKVVLNNGKDIPTILLANKWDIGESSVSDEVVTKFCRENGIVAWFKTSAKTNFNIGEAMNCLIGAVIKCTTPDSSMPPPSPQKDRILLHHEKPIMKNKSDCCK